MKEINENELQLKITKKELGSLTTNAITIRNKIKELLPNYSAENYSAKNIDKAKADKALLNKTSKALNDERIKIEKEFMKPFEEFKNIVKETTDMVKEASSKIDEIVKKQEEIEKNEKKSEIIKIFNENIEELNNILTFEKIFNDKWLNKSYSLKSIEEEIKEKIKLIRNDLITIGALKSKYEIELKNDYLSHFDLGTVIRKNEELISKEELLKVQQSESEKIVEVKKEEKLQKMANEKVEESLFEETLTYTLKITGKLNQLQALKQFLDINEMQYEKIEK